MKKIVLFVLCILYLEASETITQQRAQILDNKKDIGYITVLTPVDVVSQKDGIATVKITGYRNENYPQLIVRGIKQSETYAMLDDEKTALKLFKVKNTTEDDYGEVWQEVEGEVKIKSSLITDDKDELYQKAKKTYAQNCSMCHRLHEPESFTVNQWPHQIETMMQKVALEKPIKNLIIKYLQQNASDAK